MALKPARAWSLSHVVLVDNCSKKAPSYKGNFTLGMPGFGSLNPWGLKTSIHIEHCQALLS